MQRLHDSPKFKQPGSELKGQARVTPEPKRGGVMQ